MGGSHILQSEMGHRGLGKLLDLSLGSLTSAERTYLSGGKKAAGRKVRGNDY